MPHAEYLCSHKIVDDERNGCSVCTECGFVLESQLFTQNFKEFQFEEIPAKNLEIKEEIRELLHRINLPDLYSSQITKNVYGKKKKDIPYTIYKTLNDQGCGISIKDISAISGLDSSEIYKSQEKDKVIIMRPEEMLEKYTKKLDLDFKAYAVIKEKIIQSCKTGHNPMTIVGVNIYLYCKENNLKLSMKTIAKTLNISCISIQRYLKKK